VAKRLWLTLVLLAYFPLTLPASPIGRSYANWEQAEAEFKKNGYRQAEQICYELTTIAVEQKEGEDSFTTMRIVWKCRGDRTEIAWCAVGNKMDWDKLLSRSQNPKPEPTPSTPETDIHCSFTPYFKGYPQHAYIYTKYAGTFRLYRH
jgi:hypothetical protein